MIALLVSKNIKKNSFFTVRHKQQGGIDVLKIVACHLNLLESLTLCFFLTFYIIFESYDKAKKTALTDSFALCSTNNRVVLMSLK